MTPLAKANLVYRSDELSRSDHADRLEAAITAYLTALSEDEGTVEKVARGIAQGRVYCPLDKPDGVDYWRRHGDVHRADARAALTAIASRDERK